MVWNHLVVQVFGIPYHVLFFLLSFSSNHLLFPKMMWGFFLHLYFQVIWHFKWGCWSEVHGMIPSNRVPTEHPLMLPVVLQTSHTSGLLVWSTASIHASITWINNQNYNKLEAMWVHFLPQKSQWCSFSWINTLMITNSLPFCKHSLRRGNFIIDTITLQDISETDCVGA